MNVPFIDLRKQLAAIQAEIEAAIQKVLQSGQFILGKEVNLFEKEVAAYIGTTEAITVGNGSDAIYLSLKALDIGPGDEVITTPFSFVASSDAILRAGAAPVFVDIEPDTFNLDPEQIENKITPRTRAILPVHLYGQSAQMDKIRDLANRYSLYVIEDACQAFGASFLGKKVGAWGDVGCFSFFPTKNLGGYGDGGVIVTSDKEIAKKLRMLRGHGSESRYHHVMLGINSRLDEIQAAILRIKLRYLDHWNAQRKEIAQKYFSLLKGIPLSLPTTNPFADHIYHLFAVRNADKLEREKFVSFLHGHGIETAIHYPKPIYMQPSYQTLGYQQGLCPHAEEASDQVCAIPLYPELTDEAVMHVVNAITTFYKGVTEHDA